MDLKNLPKVNQIIYTLDTICDPNSMILAQGVLEIFCSQASYIGMLLEKMERGDNSVMDLEFFFEKLIRSSTP